MIPAIRNKKMVNAIKISGKVKPWVHLSERARHEIKVVIAGFIGPEPE
jgi:hypothetical protein